MRRLWNNNIISPSPSPSPPGRDAVRMSPVTGNTYIRGWTLQVYVKLDFANAILMTTIYNIIFYSCSSDYTHTRIYINIIMSTSAVYTYLSKILYRSIIHVRCTTKYNLKSWSLILYCGISTFNTPFQSLLKTFLNIFMIHFQNIYLIKVSRHVRGTYVFLVN